MPRNSNKPWIPEDDKRLLELKAAGKSNGAIGVALARSTGSIIGRLSVLNTRTARLKRLRQMLKASLKGRPSVYRIRQIETPMETQAIRSQIEAATPMAPLPSKANQSSPKVDNSNDAKPG